MEIYMKDKILFVDDEIKILDGLKRLLHSMRNTWEIKFANSGAQALNYLENESFDIIITDVRMPEMDGVELLKKVKERFPGIVRIILSGHSETNMIIKSINVTHTYLSKPCEAEILKNTIRNLLELKKIIPDNQLRNTLSEISIIPSSPHQYQALISELVSPSVSIETLTSIIKHDMGMTAKILQLLNSAFLGTKKKYYYIDDAIKLFGIDMLKSLFLSENIVSCFQEQSIFTQNFDHLITTSIKRAQYAGTIALSKKLDKKTISNVYLAAFLLDIGKIIIYTYLPDAYIKISDLVNIHKMEYLTAEKEILGVDEYAVGSYLIKLWGFTEEIVKTFNYYATPLKCPPTYFNEISCVHIANALLYKSNEDTPDRIRSEEFLKQINKFDKLDTYRALLNN